MKIFDAHNDCFTGLKNIKEVKDYLKRIKETKYIKKICCVIWTTKIKNPLNFIRNVNKLILDNNLNKKIILCIEDLGFVNEKNFDKCIYLLKCVKPFYCGLVWNFDNKLGGGAYGKSRLTKLGKKLIFELEKNGICIDTAHMNKKTFNDFIKITTKPILNSHGNFCFYKKHCRNLSNKQITNIIKSKGQICLSFVNEFISDYLIDLSIIAQQIAVFVNKFGYKNLSIGTDLFGTINLPINFKSYYNFKILKDELKKLCFSNKIIRSIFYKNFLNFYKKMN